MSEIKVGDLVVVVRTCCAETAKQSLGVIAKVVSIHKTTMRCMYCRAFMTMDRKAGFDVTGKFNGAPLSWLRRIPPFSELESTEHKEETPA